MRALQPAVGWRRIALIALTIGALVLALLGVLLPGLPTTPFVLVASYGLMRTSRRWHQRLLESRLFGGVLRDWHLHRGISAHVRTKALALLAIVAAAIGGDAVLLERCGEPVIAGAAGLTGSAPTEAQETSRVRVQMQMTGRYSLMRAMGPCLSSPAA